MSPGREIVHVNVTAHPTAAWTAQQIVEAFPGDGDAPQHRDRQDATEGPVGGLHRRYVGAA